MEILIVIAIISILSSIIVYKSRNINANQNLMQCKANILELAAAMEAYKASHGFYFGKDPKGHSIGAEGKSTFRCIMSNGNDELLDFDEYKFLPRLYCPLGDLRNTASGSNGTINCTYSYEIRSRYEEYSLICFKHWNTGVLYEHLKGKPGGWRENVTDGMLYLETQDQTYWGKDSW